MKRNSLRLFVAINFPDEIRTIIATIRDTVNDLATSGRFSDTENLHLTLVFLGACNPDETETIKAVLYDTVFSEFSLVLDQVDRFRRKGGDTWWIGLKKNQRLFALQSDLSERIRQKGFILENRQYFPHISIGREIRMNPRFILPQLQQVSFNVTSIELMKSEHINGKLTYTPIFSKNATKIIEKI